MQETCLNRNGRYDECEHLVGTELRALIAANGHVQVRHYCLDCDQSTSDAIPHILVPNVNALPVHADYRQPIPCERCGVIGSGVELHHWAPKHLFEDYERWPTSNLCVPCHERWHKTVTPAMTERRAS